MQNGSQRKDNSSNFHWKQLQRAVKNDSNSIYDDSWRTLILNSSSIPGQPHGGGLPVEPGARHGQQEQLHPDLLGPREHLQPRGVRHQSFPAPDKYELSILLLYLASIFSEELSPACQNVFSTRWLWQNRAPVLLRYALIGFCQVFEFYFHGRTEEN